MLQFLCINFTIDVYHLCLILSSHTLVKDITIIQEAKCFEYVYFAQSKNILWNIQYKVQGPQSMELISENLKTLSLSNCFKESARKSDLVKNLSNTCILISS